MISLCTCGRAPMTRSGVGGLRNMQRNRPPPPRRRIRASAPSIERQDAMVKAAGYRFLTAACCAAAILVAQVASRGQGRGAAEEGLELVDQNVLRVCSDPNNLPFSNDKGEGFENKLAELFATKLDRKLAYTYYPQATGFVRITLGSHRCDVIIGYPQGDDMVQSTNPYY